MTTTPSNKKVDNKAVKDTKDTKDTKFDYTNVEVNNDVLIFLYDNYFDNLLRTATKLGIDSDEAYDLIMGLIVKLSTKLDMKKSRGEITNYIMTSTRNTCYTYLKQSNRFLGEDYIQTTVDMELDFFDDIQLVRDIISVLKNNDDELDNSIIIFYLEGKSNNEIYNIVKDINGGITIKEIKVVINKMKLKIKEKWKN